MPSNDDVLIQILAAIKAGGGGTVLVGTSAALITNRPGLEAIGDVSIAKDAATHRLARRPMRRNCRERVERCVCISL